LLIIGQEKVEGRGGEGMETSHHFKEEFRDPLVTVTVRKERWGKKKR